MPAIVADEKCPLLPVAGARGGQIIPGRFFKIRSAGESPGAGEGLIN